MHLTDHSTVIASISSGYNRIRSIPSTFFGFHIRSNCSHKLEQECYLPSVLVGFMRESVIEQAKKII